MSQIVLASASPRRKNLLEQINLSFICHPSGVEEKAEGSCPEEIASSLALLKARDVARMYPGHIVLGADTMVVSDGRILGKPRDPEEASAMLNMLNGRAHNVVTGVALVRSAREIVGTERTTVYFRSLRQDEITRYVASGEPMDKAGAYGIQGLGSLLVCRVEGCYNNVVGLPLAKVCEMLNEFGITLL